MDKTLFEYLLRLGDDALILGQRLSEWTGHAPTIEVDLSLANLSLDLVGQATHFLNLAGEAEGQGRDADALAFHRDAFDFRNCLLVEQPNGDFAQTMARHLLFSLFQELHYEKLTASSNAQIADVAAKALKEVRYHVELAREWVIRLGDGTEESHQRMLDGLDWNWRFVEELFTMDDVDTAMAEAGIGADKAALRPTYDAKLAAILTQATLPQPNYPRGIFGGRTGRHSEHLGHLLAEMQHIPRSYPDARW